jgi:hypothetical protein
MRKLYTTVAVLVLSLSVGLTALAQGKMDHKGSAKAGCASCDKSCATPEQMKKFKADSIDLRQEMMNKRFDLQRENLKDAPDSAKVTAIKAEIETVKAKLMAMKTAAKLPDSACSCLEDCPLMDGSCGKCGTAGKCSCECCKKAGSCAKCTDCKDCKNCADCSCAKCSKKAGCDSCNKKKPAGKAAKKCSNCDKSGK